MSKQTDAGMCERDGRDETGRFRPGASGNPKGRPAVSRFARLLAEAAAAGCEIVIRLPARIADAPDEAAPTTAEGD